jgi:hypothetical protein
MRPGLEPLGAQVQHTQTSNKLRTHQEKEVPVTKNFTLSPQMANNNQGKKREGRREPLRATPALGVVWNKTRSRPLFSSQAGKFLLIWALRFQELVTPFL